MNLIAIDPGTSAKGPGCACVAFKRDRVVALWFATAADPFANVPDDVCETVDFVVWERPQARKRGSGAVASAEILIALAAEGAALAATYAADFEARRVLARTPSTWKGSLPKPVQHAALWAVLTDEERTLFGGDTTWRAIELAREKGARRRWPAGHVPYPRAFATHNLLDAAALGCVELGRLPTKGTRL